MGPLKHYFDQYFFNPTHWRLTNTQKVFCVMATVALSILSVGLIPLGVGVYKMIDRFKPISISIPTSHFHDVHRRIIRATQNIFKLSDSDLKMGDLTRSKFSNIIQVNVLEKFYRKPLPNKEDVLVPVIPEMMLTNNQAAKKVQQGDLEFIRFVDLTKEQKITLNNHFGREHNQIRTPAALISEEKVDEYFFTVHGQAQFLENDPKGGHGCDHAIRASILVPMFAYLYQKYHPSVQISEKVMLVAELAASYHDCQRSAEGTDVYDDLSAESAVMGLKELGIQDETLIYDTRHAISDKDHDPLDTKEPKSIIAKLVQNADSADFTRILLKSDTQSKGSFDSSKNFLDIYKELHKISGGDPKFVLKDGLTFGDFIVELDVLLEEKNKLAFQTHHRPFRESASDPSKNYYQEVLNKVSFDEYPNLHSVLSLLNVNYANQSNSKIHPYLEIAKFHWREMTVEALEQKIVEVQALAGSLLKDEVLVQLQKRVAAKQQVAANTALPANVELDNAVVELLQTPYNVPTAQPLFLHTDTDSIRKRQLRLQRKEFDDGKQFVEVSFEFRKASRENFEKTLAKLRENTPAGVTLSDSKMRFYKKEEDGRFSSQKYVEASSSLTIEKNGVSIEIGTNKKDWNCWNLAICKVPVGLEPALMQDLFATIGLEGVLSSSHEKDADKEFLYKIIQFRYPDKFFATWPRPEIEKIYQELSPQEKAVIDRDLEQKKLVEVSGNYFEYVQPAVVDEAIRAGARGFVTNIISPDAATGAQIVLNIIKTSLLSTIERYQQGIIGLGTCPAYNIEHGSANQAFTRLVTAGFLNKKYNFKDLGYAGGTKLFIFYGVQAAERLPYAYPFDCGGMRNPEFANPEFKIHGFKTLNNVKGHELQKFRKTIPELAAYVDSVADPISQGNEVMFDRALGSKYVKLIMVPENMRKGILDLLKAHGIEQLNGQPIEECIVNAGALDPIMLE